MKSNSSASLWQRFASYFTDVELERVPGEPELELLMRSNRLMLCTPNAVYSYQERYQSFSFAVSQSGRKPHRVLILGFGLASIPQILLKRAYHPELFFTAIEFDPRIIQLALNYVDNDVLARCDLIAADATEWILQNQEQFDMICVDLFVDQSVPEACSSEGFQTALKKAVATGGVLLFSRLNTESQAVRKEFTDQFERTFEGHERWTSGGNDIFAWYEGSGNSRD